jgi:heat shock protein HslJ
VATVTVAAAAEAPKAASPEGPVIGPVIDTFAVLPMQVTLGECVALRWVVGGDARSIRIMRDGVVLVEGAPNSGSGSDCPTAPGTVRYELAAADAEGRTATAEAAVEARAPVPTATPAPAAADTAPDTAPLAAPLAAPAATLAPAPLATPVGVPDASPVGREYVLISYRAEGGQLASPLTGTRVTAHFEAGGTLRGEGGCNTYHSTYTIGDGALAIAPLAATEKFCAEPIGIMDQEQHYLSALQTAAAFTLEGGMLTLLDGAGNPVAVFVPAQ